MQGSDEKTIPVMYFSQQVNVHTKFEKTDCLFAKVIILTIEGEGAVKELIFTSI